MNDLYNAIVHWATAKYAAVYGDLDRNVTNSKISFIIIINCHTRLKLCDEYLRISTPIGRPIVDDKLYYSSPTFLTDLEKLIDENTPI